MITRKVCLIGDFGVGKTSLVRRFVQNVFSHEYLTTVGVDINVKTVQLDGGVQVKLVIWDIAGSDRLSSVKRSYLQGAAGYLLVADVTRPATLHTAMELKALVDRELRQPPSVALLNKCDLQPAHEVDLPAGIEWHHTSALTGEGVEAAFLHLARALTEQRQ